MWEWLNNNYGALLGLVAIFIIMYFLVSVGKWLVKKCSCNHEGENIMEDDDLQKYYNECDQWKQESESAFDKYALTFSSSILGLSTAYLIDKKAGGFFLIAWIFLGVTILLIVCSYLTAQLAASEKMRYMQRLVKKKQSIYESHLNRGFWVVTNNWFNNIIACCFIIAMIFFIIAVCLINQHHG